LIDNPDVTNERGDQPETHDGAAAIAISLLTIALLVFLVYELVH
jgi:hypothetical protein